MQDVAVILEAITRVEDLGSHGMYGACATEVRLSNI